MKNLKEQYQNAIKTCHLTPDEKETMLANLIQINAALDNTRNGENNMNATAIINNQKTYNNRQTFSQVEGTPKKKVIRSARLNKSILAAAVIILALCLMFLIPILNQDSSQLSFRKQPNKGQSENSIILPPSAEEDNNDFEKLQLTFIEDPHDLAETMNRAFTVMFDFNKNSSNYNYENLLELQKIFSAKFIKNHSYFIQKIMNYPQIGDYVPTPTNDFELNDIDPESVEYIDSTLPNLRIHQLKASLKNGETFKFELIKIDSRYIIDDVILKDATFADWDDLAEDSLLKYNIGGISKKLEFAQNILMGNIDRDSEVVEVEGIYVQKVVQNELRSFSDVEEHLSSVFTKDFIENYSNLYSEENPLYLDHKGELYIQVVDGPVFAYDWSSAKLLETSKQTLELHVPLNDRGGVTEIYNLVETEEGYRVESRRSTSLYESLTAYSRAPYAANEMSPPTPEEVDRMKSRMEKAEKYLTLKEAGKYAEALEALKEIWPDTKTTVEDIENSHKTGKNSIDLPVEAPLESADTSDVTKDDNSDANKDNKVTTSDYREALTDEEKQETRNIAMEYYLDKDWLQFISSVETDEVAKYFNEGKESNYSPGNIIIYDVTVIDDGVEMVRTIAIARDVGKDWHVINEGYVIY